MGAQKRAYIASMDDGPLEGMVAGTSSGKLSVEYDIANGPDTQWFLDNVIGSSRSSLDHEIVEFAKGIGIPEQAVDLVAAHLESLDRMKRQGMVRKVYPIGMNGSDEAARGLMDLDYSYYSGKMTILQEQFMGKVLLFADFGELKAMMYGIYDRFKFKFLVKEQGIAENAAEAIKSDRSSDHVVVLLPLYVRPVTSDLRRQGIDASKMGHSHSSDMKWQADVLADTLRELGRSDAEGSGALTGEASLSLSRYTLMRAVGSLNSIKDYFYSLRFKHMGYLTEKDRKAVRELRSDEEAREYYSRRQEVQWREFGKDLPNMRQFLRKDDYRRIERVATRMKMAA